MPTDIARFARHYGLDAQALCAAHPLTGYEEHFEILGADVAFDGRVAAALCKPVGRFGNVVLQALNATLFARRCGIGAVGIVGGPEPQAGGMGRAVDGLTCAFADDLHARPAVAARFLGTQALAPVLSGLEAAELDAVMRHHVAPLWAHLDAADLGPGTIVVHIRAGDIFTEADTGDDWINRLYVQPPTSYYITAIEACRQAFGAGDVRIVYQGLANPALQALVGELLRRRIPFAAQSASVSADLGTILGATHLVTSYGTFCEAAALLSSRLRSFWCFRAIESHRHLHPRPTSPLADILLHRGVAVRRVEDVQGGYIAPMSWANTPAQLALIRDYPAIALSVRPVEPGDAT